MNVEAFVDVVDLLLIGVSLWLLIILIARTKGLFDAALRMIFIALGALFVASVVRINQHLGLIAPQVGYMALIFSRLVGLLFMTAGIFMLYRVVEREKKGRSGR